jgi:hypothetical protein
MSLCSFTKIEEIIQLLKSGKKLAILDTENSYHTIPFFDKNGKMIAIYGDARGFYKKETK